MKEKIEITKEEFEHILSFDTDCWTCKHEDHDEEVIPFICEINQKWRRE